MADQEFSIGKPFPKAAGLPASTKGDQEFSIGKPFPTTAAEIDPGKMSWNQIFSRDMSGDIAKSAGQVAEGFLAPVVHPQDTATSFGMTAMGEMKKLQNWIIDPAEMQTAKQSAMKQFPMLAGWMDKQNQESLKYADAFNHYYGERYGTVEGFKRAIAKDPVGVLADLSMFASLGGDALARAPGVVGKTGEILSKAGEVTNPVTMAGKAAKQVGRGGATLISGLLTHSGSDALKIAARAGVLGGQFSQQFLKHLRGEGSISDIVQSAKGAVQAMRTERAALYKAGMAGLSDDPRQLSFDEIDKGMAEANRVKTFAGVDLSKSTAAVRKQLMDTVEEWKAKQTPQSNAYIDESGHVPMMASKQTMGIPVVGSQEPPGFAVRPAVNPYHTPEGFDALKQIVGDIRDNLQYDTPQWVAANDVYHAIRKTIVNQAPKYGEVMADYEKASRQIEEIQKTFSLGKGVPIDTSTRKLLSILRDNVNTNYGRRAELGKVLEKYGAKGLPYQLAGETLKSWLPHGIGRPQAVAALGAAILHHPAALGLIPFMSPRTMGEASHWIGRGAPLGQYAGQAAQVARVLGADQAMSGDWTGNAQDVAGYFGLPYSVVGPQPEQQQQPTGGN